MIEYPKCPSCSSGNTECMGTFEIFSKCWKAYYCKDCKTSFKENFKKEKSKPKKKKGKKKSVKKDS